MAANKKKNLNKESCSENIYSVKSNHGSKAPYDYTQNQRNNPDKYFTTTQVNEDIKKVIGTIM
jgi:hypothetical protein